MQPDQQTGASAVAVGLLAEIPTTLALADGDSLRVVFQPLRIAMALGALVALAAGLAAPSPLLLALILGAVLSVLWFFAVSRFLRARAWAGEPPMARDEPRPSHARGS